MRVLQDLLVRLLTLKGPNTTLVGSLSSDCRHCHHVPFDVEQEISEIDPDVNLI